jgi:hypothetical protein
MKGIKGCEPLDQERFVNSTLWEILGVIGTALVSAIVVKFVSVLFEWSSTLPQKPHE